MIFHLYSVITSHEIHKILQFKKNYYLCSVFYVDEGHIVSVTQYTLRVVHDGDECTLRQFHVLLIARHPPQNVGVGHCVANEKRVGRLLFCSLLLTVYYYQVECHFLKKKI
jgi:hypothetical protein